MIGYLKGNIIHKDDSSVIIDVNGVGYRVFIATSIICDIGQDVNLWTHTYVKEDNISLYGFGSLLDLQVFEALITLQGIGPKLALAILSTMSASEVIHAINSGNTKALMLVSGLGSRIALRLINELSKKMLILSAFADHSSTPISTELAIKEDALLALKSLGYNDQVAKKMVDEITQSNQDISLEDLVKLSLQKLSKKN